MSTEDSMSLAAETWTPASINDLVLSFLRGEWEKLDNRNPITDKRLITHPDIADSQQNQLRVQLLFGIRSGLLSNIPPDTRWFTVKYLRPRHFHELHAIRCEGWNDPADRNELSKVAARMRLELRGSSPEYWQPILWGHSVLGPFSILEGNHRLAALAGRPEIQDLAMSSYVGISGQQCVWHRPDWP
jgi:hypothetical protein